MANIDMEPDYDPGAVTTWPGQRGPANPYQGAQPPGVSSGPSNPYAPYFGQGAGIASAYKKYLGRDISGSLDENDQSTLGEYQSWLGNSDYESGIANSAEAQAYKARQSAGGGAPSGGGYSNTGQYVPPQPAGGGSAGTGVFNDPATQNFEALLNDRIKQLQTPYNNPDFQPAIDQMRGYLQRLNGPAYTPQQMDLIQTQALDPLERQRTAAKQQVMQRLASRGIGPTSGILEKALEDVDRQFGELRTKTQAGFATNAIGLDRQNAAQAAQLAPLIASMQQQQFAGQDARAGQAVNLAQIVPNMAWSRLMGANNAIMPINPLQALGGLQNMQNQNAQNDAAYWGSLMQTLWPIFFGNS